MRNKAIAIVIGAIAASTLIAWTFAPDENATATLTYGTPALESMGALAFGPDDILFVGDSEGAAVYAIEIADTGASSGAINVGDLDAKLAAMFGTTADDITVRDMAVHPRSGNVYLSVARGDGNFGLVKVDGSGQLSEVSLTDVRFSKGDIRSEEHTSELQSRRKLVCRLLLEKQNPPPPPCTRLHDHHL